jgi:hypothetical protein
VQRAVFNEGEDEELGGAFFQLGVLAWDTHMWDCNSIPRLMLEHRSAATHECKVASRLNGVGMGAQSVDSRPCRPG